MIADIRPALRAYLLADSGIAALVGDRIYHIKMPQGVTQPSIVFNRISGQGDHHMQGASGLNRPRIQIDCWAKSSADAAVALANLVKERIDGFKGSVGYGSNSPQDSVTVQGVFFESERDDYDSDSEFYRVSHDYLIWYEER